MPGRLYNNPSAADSCYRFGFNGKEKSNEMEGNGVDYDYGFRIYDARLGRFLSVDPLTGSYPWNSPYSYAEGDVIRSIDVEGLEKLIVTINKDKYGRVESMTLEGLRDKDIKQAVDADLKYANKKDVTVRDVLIITKQQGKKDVLSYDNLNAGYQKQIEKAKTDDDIEDDESMTIPDGANGAIGKDAIYNGQVLSGAATYDNAKYEAFKSIQKYQLSTPIYGSYQNHILQLNAGTDDQVGILAQNLTDEINTMKDQFVKDKNLKTAVIDQIQITVRSKDINVAQKAAAQIEKNLGVKVVIKKDDKINNGPEGTDNSPAYLDVKYSGVK